MMVAWTSFIVSITGSLGDDSTVLVEPSKKLDRSRRSLYPDQKSQTVQDGETTLRMQSANHSDASDIPELLIGEYRDPGVEFGYRFPMTLKDGEELPEPVQIVEDYMALHSADALRKNPDLENRRFIIGTTGPSRSWNEIDSFSTNSNTVYCSSSILFMSISSWTQVGKQRKACIPFLNLIASNMKFRQLQPQTP